jgi:hypothetical protein
MPQHFGIKTVDFKFPAPTLLLALIFSVLHLSALDKTPQFNIYRRSRLRATVTVQLNST